MNKFNQWFATMPTWQFLTLLATMMGLMIGLTMHCMGGQSPSLSKHRTHATA